MKINNPNLKFRTAITGTNNPKKILLHHALHPSCDIFDIHTWHIGNGWSGCGYHYFIKRNGSVWIGRTENLPGAHCKENHMNFNSISICLEGCYESYIPQGTTKDLWQKEGPTPEQLQSTKELCQSLLKKYNLKIADIEPHCKHATYKKCPGTWDYNNFIKNINTKTVEPVNKKELTWKEILKLYTNDFDTWEKALVTAIATAKQDSNLGDLEIFKYFPDLIQQIYNRQK
jgi:hypothetical protein